MALATADADGQPSVRMVLLKGHGPEGFVFYTNDAEPQGRASSRANPHAALLFHWKSLRRQVRVEGPVERVRDAEADAYFASRGAGFAARRLGVGPVAAARQPRDVRSGASTRCKRGSKGRTCRARRIGAAIASCPSGSSSGRTGRTGCTSGGCSSRDGRRLERRAALPMTDRQTAAERFGAVDPRAALASVALALVLLIAKGWAALATDSTAMLGSLADTALDFIASLDDAGSACGSPPQPADRDHRFGHGKAEALVALVQVVADHRFARIGIAWRAIERLINGGADRRDGARHRRVAVRDRRDLRADLPTSATSIAPHRLGRDRDRQCALQVRPAAQRGR